MTDDFPILLNYFSSLGWWRSIYNSPRTQHTAHVQKSSCWNCVRRNYWCGRRTRNRNTSWKGLSFSMADLHDRIMWLLPWPSRGPLVLHTKYMENDLINSLLLIHSVSSSDHYHGDYKFCHSIYIVANALKCFVQGTHSVDTMMEGQLNSFCYDVPRALLQHSQFLRASTVAEPWPPCIDPPSNYNGSHVWNTDFHTTACT